MWCRDCLDWQKSTDERKHKKTTLFWSVYSPQTEALTKCGTPQWSGSSLALSVISLVCLQGECCSLSWLRCPRHRLPVTPRGIHHHTGRTAGRHGRYNCHLLLVHSVHRGARWLNQKAPLHPSSLPCRQNSRLLWDGVIMAPSVFGKLQKKKKGGGGGGVQTARYYVALFGKKKKRNKPWRT